MLQHLAPNGFFLNKCAFSKNGKLALQFGSLHFNQNIFHFYDVSGTSAKSLFNVTSAVVHGSSYQDVVSTMQFDQTGSVLYATSWGAGIKSVPTLRLISLDAEKDVFKLTTEGSMFSGDIAHRGGKTYRLSAAGKAVHANKRGDFYVFDVTLD